MTEDSFDIPDMDALSRMMGDAMAETERAMEDIPAQVVDVMGDLSDLMGGLPDELQELSAAVSGFGDLHAANMSAAVGEPDWSLQADIRVGKALHVAVTAEFDLQMVVDAWESVQGGELESLVSGLMQGEAGDGLEPGMMGQVMDQLKQGRTMAAVRSVEVLKCRFAGAPGNAAETLQLSPEAGIGLALNDGGLAFEFAPMLTIRNGWENADIPTFAPTVEDVVVDLSRFEGREAFSLNFVPGDQEYDLSIELGFAPIE